MLSVGIFLGTVTPYFETGQLVGDSQDKDDRPKAVFKQWCNGKVVRNLKWKDRIVYFKGKLFVLKENCIQMLISDTHHNTPTAECPSQLPTSRWSVAPNQTPLVSLERYYLQPHHGSTLV